MVSLCLVTLIFSWTKISFTLRRYKIQVPSQVSQAPSQAIPLNIARYRKGASLGPDSQVGEKGKRRRRLFFCPRRLFFLLALWVQASSVNYLLSASCCSRNLYRSKSDPWLKSVYLVPPINLWSFMVSLVFLNSSLNSFLSCRKIWEIRQAVKNTLMHIFCSSS